MHHLIAHNLNVCIAKSKFYFFMLKKISTDDAPFVCSQINVKGYFLMLKKLNRNDAPFVGAIPFLNATRKSFLTER